MADEESATVETEETAAETEQDTAEKAETTAGDQTAEKGTKTADGSEKGFEGEAEAKAEADWRDGITDKKTREIADRYASPADMAKATAEMRAELAQRIKIPGKKASEEEVAAFHKAIGVPETPEAYGLKAPEGAEETESDKAFQATMAQIFHQTGVPAATAKALNDKWNELTASVREQQEQAIAKAAEEAKAALEKEWGPDFKPNVEHGVRVGRQFGDEDFEEFREMTVDGTGMRVGDHPAFLRMMAKVGRSMSEDGLSIGVTGDERNTVESDHAKLTAQMHDAMDRGDRAEAERLDKKRSKLSERLVGNTPIVGSEGRAA